MLFASCFFFFNIYFNTHLFSLAAFLNIVKEKIVLLCEITLYI